jgi:hypothetical protein
MPANEHKQSKNKNTNRELFIFSLMKKVDCGKRVAIIDILKVN